jgi:hypothetical protein
LQDLKEELKVANDRPVFDLSLTTEVRKMRALLDDLKPAFDLSQTVQEEHAQKLQALKD